MFKCTKCGICCRNIGEIPELAEYHKGDGVCIYLSEDNLCMIYQTRPDICNVEKMYTLRYKDIMTKEVYDKVNMEGCLLIQDRYGFVSSSV